MATGNRSRGYNGITNAVSAAVIDRLSQRETITPVPESVRIDGKVCLVTGSNSGLGKAVAIDLAKRGGRVLMACRSGHPSAGEEVKRMSGSDDVEMLKGPSQRGLPSPDARATGVRAGHG